MRRGRAKIVLHFSQNTDDSFVKIYQYELLLFQIDHWHRYDLWDDLGSSIFYFLSFYGEKSMLSPFGYIPTR